MWYTEKITKYASKDFLHDEALKYNSEDEFVKALEDQGKIHYHGSPNVFDNFSYEHLGTQGTSEGKGFYFTSDKDIARGYMGENGTGKMFEAYINVKKPLSPTKLTINARGLAKFIKALDPTGDEYLSNYGDVSYEGYNKVLRDAIDNLLSYSDNDVDLISGIANAYGGNPEMIYPVLEATLGYDGIIIEEPSWGGTQTITVAFNNDQIMTKDKLADFHRKLRTQM